MIVRLIRNLHPAGYLVFIIIAILVMVIGYFSGYEVITSQAMPLFHLLVQWIKPDKTIFYFLAGSALVIMQSLHLNSIFNRYELTKKKTLLPGVIYLLIICSVPNFISFNPVLPVNSILILVLDKIFRLYKNENPLPLIFDMALLISVASLIYFPASVFVLLVALGLIILRPFSWRDWVTGFIGLLTPYFFYVLYVFLTGKQHHFQLLVEESGITNNLNIQNVLPRGYSILAIYIGALLVFSIFKIRENYYRVVVRVRNFHQIIFVLGIVSMLMIAITDREALFRYSIMSITVTSLLTIFFLEAKKLWVAELMMYILAVIIAFNYFL